MIKDILKNEIEEKIPEIKINDHEKNIIVSGTRWYNEDKSHRYCLSVTIDKHLEKRLTVIMLNPSEAKDDKRIEGFFVDQTITNVIKIANAEGYGQIVILNLFSIKNPNSKNVEKYFQQHKKNPEEYKKYCSINQANIDYILKILENSSDILVAWGDKFKNNTSHKYVKRIIDKLKSNNNNTFTFCKAKKNYPKHPGRIDLACCENCYGRNGKIDLIPYSFG